MRRLWPALFCLALSCGDDDAPLDCGPLPDRTACPLRGGGSCDDRDCSAVYSCSDQGWKLVETCQRQAAAGAPATSAQGGNGGAGPTCMASAPVASPCTPLLAPECDASLLDGCKASACQLGCEVFLRCNNGEWQAGYVAYCNDEGELVETGR